jgi:hypothetical protein
MARLTTQQRKDIPSSDFAVPADRSKSGDKGGYPIEDESHARNALARVSQHGSPAGQAQVKRKVAQKYPGINQKQKSPSHIGGD